VSKAGGKILGMNSALTASSAVLALERR